MSDVLKYTELPEAVSAICDEVSFFANCVTTDNPSNRSLSWTIERIKNGAWKKFADQAKSFTDPNEYLYFKSYKVPAYTVHGIFSKRCDEGLIQYNGFTAHEIDNITDVESVKQKLICNPYVYALFRSISGKGLVIFSRVNDTNMFTEMYEGLVDYYNNELKTFGLKIDEGAKGLSRLRIVSYDPDLYLNEAAMVWKNLPLYKPKNGKKSHLLPKDNHRANILPHIAAQMAVGKSDNDILKGLEGVHIDPNSVCSDPEHIDKLIEDLRQRYFAEAEKNGVSVAQYSGFWTNNFKNTDYQLSLGLLADILNVLGYCLLDGEYVRVTDGVIYKVKKQELYAFIIDLVSYKEVSFKAKDITFTVDQTALQTRAQKEIRGNVSILAIREFKYKILRDSASEVFFHFKNGSLVITKGLIAPFIRESKHGVIWEDQIMPHEIGEEEDVDTVFKQFLQNISGENFDSFRSALGYVLRNYNGSDGMKVLWMCDESYEVGKNNGRTGKSLVSKAIGKCRKMDDCSGKDFNAENQFKFQNIDRSTQVYVIDDVKQKFDFRAMYNFSTEGAEFSRKHRDRIKLPLAETPQLIITSNYPPEIEQGSSTTGRLHILPFKPFYLDYADQGGVKHIHKQVFFDDWDPLEWNRFYWFMARCIQYFLQDGLIPSSMKAIRCNRLKAVCSIKFKSNELANDFVDWVYQYDMPAAFSLEELISSFQPDGDIDQQAFAACLKAYFDLERINYTKKRERIDAKQITRWRI